MNAYYPSIRKGRPVYLSGVGCRPLDDLESAGADVGLLIQPDSHLEDRALRTRLWAADNGMFTGKVDEARWWGWLGSLPRDTLASWGDDHLSRLMAPTDRLWPYGCAFVTAPDVPGDMAATWARSQPWLSRVRALGFPVAVCAQNGAEDFAPLWDESDSWDALFVGGMPDETGAEWKLSEWARLCVHEAHLLAKWTHLGRVNSAKRLRIAAGWDVDSVDGTYLAFGPHVNGARLSSWLDDLAAQPSLL